MYGLLDRDVQFIRLALEKFPEIQCAILFGSRAMGTEKQGSDVDLAIGGERITHRTLCELDDWLNEVYPIPYMFDILHYDVISNQQLKQHIDTFGKELYTRSVNP